MLYSDTDLLREYGKEYSIKPLQLNNIQPSSIDMTLANTLLSIKVDSDSDDWAIDPRNPITGVTEIELSENQPYLLAPGEFVLGSTSEKVTLGPNVAARVEGKSSLGRCGLAVHVTAGFIDPGFEGTITLELANLGNRGVLLYPGMPIGQLCVFQLKTHATTPYGAVGLGSHYQSQDGPVASGGTYHQ